MIFNKIGKYVAFAVIVLYIFLGVYLLAGSRFLYIQKEYRVIIAIVLFLYAGWRIARLINAARERRDDEE